MTGLDPTAIVSGLPPRAAHRARSFAPEAYADAAAGVAVMAIAGAALALCLAAGFIAGFITCALMGAA